MNPVFHPRLINSPFEDPALYVEFKWERRALIFELGGVLNSLKPARLLKISHVFVSHTHIDHFIGFDTLLRAALWKEKILHLFGPPDFISNVEGKIRAYTWNLIEDYPLSIEVTEVFEDRIKRAYFRAKEGFKRVNGGEAPFSGTLVDEPAFVIGACHLDHRTPSLAFSLKEKQHINIKKEALNEMGFTVGPWLKGFKDMIREGASEDTMVEAPLRDGGTNTYILKELVERIVTITEGQKITYVVDAIYSASNADKIVELAEGSDILFCEAAFLDKDKERAMERCHLTARQAGMLAKMAGVKRLEVFHFSPRYQGLEEVIVKEAMDAFEGRC